MNIIVQNVKEKRSDNDFHNNLEKVRKGLNTIILLMCDDVSPDLKCNIYSDLNLEISSDVKPTISSEVKPNFYPDVEEQVEPKQVINILEQKIKEAKERKIQEDIENDEKYIWKAIESSIWVLNGGYLQLNYEPGRYHELIRFFTKHQEQFGKVISTSIITNTEYHFYFE
jgi:hypothetical protein